MDTVDLELVDAVERIAIVFKRRNVKHALIGGLAVGVRGRPRATKDADFIVQVPALSFPGLLEELIQEGFEIDAIPTIRRWQADNLIVFYRDGVRIDWMQPILPLYANTLKSAVERQWESSTIQVATAEDLILTKMVSFRPQDQVDIETILKINPQIDKQKIRVGWDFYAEKEPERTAWLESAFARLLPS